MESKRGVKIIDGDEIIAQIIAVDHISGLVPYKVEYLNGGTREFIISADKHIFELVNKKSVEGRTIKELIV